MIKYLKYYLHIFLDFAYFFAFIDESLWSLLIELLIGLFCQSVIWVIWIEPRAIFALELNNELREKWNFVPRLHCELRSITLLTTLDIVSCWIVRQVVITRPHGIKIHWHPLTWLAFDTTPLHWAIQAFIRFTFFNLRRFPNLSRPLVHSTHCQCLFQLR